jgi:HEAT repeat protein
MSQFESYGVDDSLSELEKCERYCSSAWPLQRMNFVKRLSHTMMAAGAFASAPRLLPLCMRLLDDDECVIRQALAVELGRIGRFLAYPTVPISDYDDDADANAAEGGGVGGGGGGTGGAGGGGAGSNAHDITGQADLLEPSLPLPHDGAEHDAAAFASGSAGLGGLCGDVYARGERRDEQGYLSVLGVVMPCLERLASDENADVRAAASDAVVCVARTLSADDVGKVALTLVLSLAHDNSPELRATAVPLLARLATILGPTLSRAYVAMEFLAFADDSAFRVRKAAASKFGRYNHVTLRLYTNRRYLPCMCYQALTLVFLSFLRFFPLGIIFAVCGRGFAKTKLLLIITCLCSNTLTLYSQLRFFSIGIIAAVCGRGFAEAKLLPVFERLAADKVWSVRR